MPEKAKAAAVTVKKKAYIPTKYKTKYTAIFIKAAVGAKPLENTATSSKNAAMITAKQNGRRPPRYFERKIFFLLMPSEKITLQCFLLCANEKRDIPAITPKRTSSILTTKSKSATVVQKKPNVFFSMDSLVVEAKV